MTTPRPTAAELVAAVADFLEHDLRDQVVGATAYQVRVATHALRIVAREPVGDEDDAGLARAIRTGDIDVDDPAVRAHLLRTVRARVAIDSPGYAAPDDGGANDAS